MNSIDRNFNTKYRIQFVFSLKMEYTRCDCILREILEDRKSLTGFLDAVFGFLSRNTDFYHIQKTKDDKLGFPRGIKENILFSCMQKYEQPYTESKQSDDLIIDDSAHLVAEEVEIVTEATEDCNTDDKTKESLDQNDIEISTPETVEIPKGTTTFSESDYKNGSIFEKYCWSQTLKDVELNVVLPKDIKLAKHIKVDLKSNHITVKTLLPKEEVLINGPTFDKYRHNDALWSITDGKLIISFDKLKECWWDRVFQDEADIDIKALDIERPIEDYSQDTQNIIEKLQIGQHCQETDSKKICLNKSEQRNRLRQSWNIEGSPFKGQPFDPSLVQFH